MGKPGVEQVRTEEYDSGGQRFGIGSSEGTWRSREAARDHFLDQVSTDGTVDAWKREMRPSFSLAGSVTLPSDFRGLAIFSQAGWGEQRGVYSLSLLAETVGL